MSKELGVDLLGKMESGNPLGCVKDRIAVAMIDAAEKDGTDYRRHDHNRTDQRQYRDRTRLCLGHQGL